MTAAPLALAAGLALAGAAAPAPADGYGAPGPHPVRHGTALWHDARRQRTVPLRWYQPHGAPQAPLIVFSHGLGGDRDAGERWLAHWASHGFLCVALQHPGSDRTLLHDSEGRASPLALRHALRGAMTREQLDARIADVRFALDEAARRAAHDEAPWHAARQTPRGMAGHSFGAVTAQALAGERRPGDRDAHPEPRLAAFVAFSPSARGARDATALGPRFAAIEAPFLSVTGTRDEGIGRSDIPAGNRLLPFAGMPDGEKYLLVLAGGAHPHFSGTRERRRPPPAALEEAVRAATTAFWKASLTDDRAARDWLRTGFPGMLGAEDRFFAK